MRHAKRLLLCVLPALFCGHFNVSFITEFGAQRDKHLSEIDKKPGRGRPRNFDLAQAVHIAQKLFHENGYEGVSLSDLTSAIQITPPSFYAAFGSKAGLFHKALQRYSQIDGLPFADILRPERDTAEALHDLLLQAASRYSAHPQMRGCLVLASRHALEPEASQEACYLQQNASDMIRDFVALRRPDAADATTSYMATVMAGLSAEARAGATPEALTQAARDAALNLPVILARSKA